MCAYYHDGQVPGARVHPSAGHKVSRREALATLIGGRAKQSSSMLSVVPDSLPSECLAAERVLSTFTGRVITGPTKPAVTKEIPLSLLQEAQGLILFSAIRTGLSLVSPMVGHGVLVARLPGSRWSCPASLNIQTVGGLGLGVDTIDCVLILRTRQAVDLFAPGKCILGDQLPVKQGPEGAHAVVPYSPERVPILGYAKSRGLFLGKANLFKGLQLRHREAEDSKFYGCYAPCSELITGHVQSQAVSLASFMGLVDAVTRRQGPPGGMHTLHAANVPPSQPMRSSYTNPALPSRSYSGMANTDSLFFRDAAVSGRPAHPSPVTRPMPVSAYPEYGSQMDKLLEMGFRDRSLNVELLAVYGGDVGRVAEVLRKEEQCHRGHAGAGAVWK
ncbi:hypothetical protein BCR37DRAFT_381715 [Protomyces lactucae-debilis]|uniref:UBA domain-containing protein n=1 Tax=Protomyces lactucae-debilis TaxID=2754530 RepID=A0A1Y2F6K5_PROLT|nr:uncharacterized protein BCR37DRAFT_381715 [Protomyces lactucae-debilis]ORY79522.1 hypothetical protein BCR37DRAFT_381715 [Protomyces lactucae-debilis]